MAVLITGGAGFVGLNVAEQLLKRGDDVVLFGPAPPPAAALAALQREPGRLLLAAGDVSQASDLDAALGAHTIDRVIHGAAVTADLAREKRAARDIFTVNLLGTVEVLEAALRHQVRRVVQLGTGSIFGAAGKSGDMLDEQTSVVLPESLYGISKFAAERTGLRYRQTRALNLTVVRLGTVFGRWEYETGVRDSLSMALQLLRAAENGAEVVIHTETADDWVYSVDVALGLIALLDLPETPEPVYHLSAGMRWSVEGWCRRLQERFPRFNYRLTDRLEECTLGRTKAAMRSPMSIARIRRDGGYEPAYLLDRAFDDYLAWRNTNREFGLNSPAGLQASGSAPRPIS
ncbi:NAD(P)-dependent oxidoreductase [Ramlibacter sp.]|uniref:NAD-dependent epimerase/dehydratase family protein n=1 Tax=Ramlibacter sp. TaxID=1917967 RepID=UPI0026163E1E|nr:NAD(P)-dependent oxidoreductase [Ramlibacter sp.]MDB5954758.1 thymidine diphosphoglucose 4,6-dehydratase [Ramlibacter sp.]